VAHIAAMALWRGNQHMKIIWRKRNKLAAAWREASAAHGIKARRHQRIALHGARMWQPIMAALASLCS